MGLAAGLLGLGVALGKQGGIGSSLLLALGPACLDGSLPARHVSAPGSEGHQAWDIQGTLALEALGSDESLDLGRANLVLLALLLDGALDDVLADIYGEAREPQVNEHTAMPNRPPWRG